MSQYEVLQGCYLPHRGGLRYFREGVIADFDDADLADIADVGDYVKRVSRSYRSKAKPVSRKDIDFNSPATVDSIVNGDVRTDIAKVPPVASTSVTRLAHEMRVAIERDQDQGIRRRVDHVAKDAMAYARLISPVRTGAYQRAWHVERKVDERRMPHYWVVNDDPKAIFIEYGTGPDKPGSKSPFGPDTPTPEFAVAARTAAAFGGGINVIL